MGGVSSVKNFLFKKSAYIAPKEEIEVSSQTSQQTTIQQESSFWDDIGLQNVVVRGNYLLWTV